MEYLQIDVYDLTVFNMNDEEVVHFDKLQDVALEYDESKDAYDMRVKNALLHTDYLRFVGKERVLTDYEKTIGGKKTTISIGNDPGRECKLIAKSKLYDPNTNQVASDIIIEIPKAKTSMKPSFTGVNGEAYSPVAQFSIEGYDGEFFKIHI